MPVAQQGPPDYLMIFAAVIIVPIFLVIAVIGWFLWRKFGKKF